MADNQTNTPMKLLFFDIDGTLIPFGGQVPESAKYALNRARSEGHQLFLCSGRSECYIADAILSLGFDGIISAAGATISHRGKRIRTLCMGERIHKLVQVLEDSQSVYVLQFPDAFHGPIRDFPWEQHERVRELRIVPEDISAQPGKYRSCEKAVVFRSQVPKQELAKRLAPEFEVTDSSFDPTDHLSCEITMAGINKSSAMACLGEYLGVSRENMIAFGDGPNDPDMLRYAGTGVAMGNAVPEAKAAADYITDPVTEDGLYHAIKALLNW